MPIRKAHELVIERGQNHVGPVHLLASLILQEESMVVSILDKMEVDVILLTDSLLRPWKERFLVVLQAASYQIFITPIWPIL